MNPSRINLEKNLKQVYFLVRDMINIALQINDPKVPFFRPPPRTIRFSIIRRKKGAKSVKFIPRFFIIAPRSNIDQKFDVTVDCLYKGDVIRTCPRGDGPGGRYFYHGTLII